MRSNWILPVLLLAAPPLRAQSAAPVALGVATGPEVPAGVVEVRYGAEVPRLACEVLHACRVELQAGERLLSPPALGDSERWLTVEVATGPGGSVPVVVVKPTECGISTNLILATDRRIYDVDLASAPCRGASPDLVRAVRFSHPGAAEAGYAGAVEPAAPTLKERAEAAPNATYRWTRRSDFPWEPARIADDGAHVYLELPPEAQSGPAPVLYSLDSGERTPMNVATDGTLLVTDRLFGRAALVIGEGSLEIERRAPRQGPVLGRAQLAAFSALGGVVAALLIGG